MRVLLTTDTFGGVWSFTKDLTRNLLEAGHSVLLVSFGRLPSSDQAAWSLAISAQYPTNYRYESTSIPLEWMTANHEAYLAAESALLRLASQFSPDLLHSNQFCFGALPLSIPVVVTAHSDVLSWAAACRPGGIENSPWLHQYCELVQRGLDCADAVVAPTQWMLNELGKHFNLPASQEQRVIANGRSVTTPLVTHTRNLQAVSAGRLWDEAKNLTLLTQIGSPMPILIAGESKHENAHVDPKHPGITMLGPLAEEQLFSLFRSSSIYIVPSLYEPFGLAPLEAALCGCAVLANDIASLREVWGSAALYFHNAATLSQQLASLISSPSDLRNAQRHSYKRALQLTASRSAQQYFALYSELLRNDSLPRREFAAYA